jgi:hypothetical protein
MTGALAGAAGQPYPTSKSQLRTVAQFHPGQTSDRLVIDPSAPPDGAGLFIFDYS